MGSRSAEAGQGTAQAFPRTFPSCLLHGLRGKRRVSAAKRETGVSGRALRWLPNDPLDPRRPLGKASVRDPMLSAERIAHTVQ